MRQITPTESIGNLEIEQAVEIAQSYKPCKFVGARFSWSGASGCGSEGWGDIPVQPSSKVDDREYLWENDEFVSVIVFESVLYGQSSAAFFRKQ